MKATKKSVGGGVYAASDGSYHLRPRVRGKLTWHKLTSRTAKEARDEGVAILRAQKLADMGVGRSPFATGSTVEALIAGYVKAGCPNRRLEAQPKDAERKVPLLRKIVGYFGQMDPETIRMRDVLGYAEWRRKQGFAQGTGDRTIDMEVAALSSVLTYGVLLGQLAQNYICSQRPRFRQARDVVRSSSVMCADGTEFNRIADALFDNPHTVAYGWQWVFATLTGLRCHEVLLLRVDAKPGEPGYLHPDRLDVYRGKGGTNPWVIMHPDLASAIACHRVWRMERGIQGPLWFARNAAGQPLVPSGLRGALSRVRRHLGLPARTVHACRAFYVTKWRRDGYSDSDVASMIGDKTVSLIHTTYGQPRPGEPKLSFRPTTGPAAWERWTPQENVVEFPAATQTNEVCREQV